MPSPADSAPLWLAELAQRGHVFLQAAQLRPLLDVDGGLRDWTAFAESWNHLALDDYMADGGRYRRRRHAVYAVDTSGHLKRQKDQPHYQSRDYNSLNGGIARWFEPIESSIADGPSLQGILRWCQRSFDALAPEVRHWHVEVHQFRIEARAGQAGLPTPEGVHRDGVDYVLVLLVRRDNIASGTTTIHAPDGRDLGSFTLTAPFDATLIDDHRVFHGVTSVQPMDATLPAYRDVLVVTFRRVAD